MPHNQRGLPLHKTRLGTEVTAAFPLNAIGAHASAEARRESKKKKMVKSSEISESITAMITNLNLKTITEKKSIKIQIQKQLGILGNKIILEGLEHKRNWMGYPLKISLQHNTTAFEQQRQGNLQMHKEGQHSSDLKGSCRLRG